MSLKPQNLIQAAEADLKRQKINTSRYRPDQYHYYAFHRQHVRSSKTVADILRRAAKSMGRKPLKTTKRGTAIIYANPELIWEALGMVEAT
jgi:hypothetical protein